MTISLDMPDMIAGALIIIAFIVMIVKAVVPQAPIRIDPQLLSIMAIATHLVLK